MVYKKRKTVFVLKSYVKNYFPNTYFEVEDIVEAAKLAVEKLNIKVKKTKKENQYTITDSNGSYTVSEECDFSAYNHALKKFGHYYVTRLSSQELLEYDNQKTV